MRCYICDTYIEEPKIDRRDGKVRPCGDCEDAITESLGEFDGYEDDENIDVEGLDVQD